MRITYNAKDLVITVLFIIVIILVLVTLRFYNLSQKSQTFAPQSEVAQDFSGGNQSETSKQTEPTTAPSANNPGPTSTPEIQAIVVPGPRINPPALPKDGVDRCAIFGLPCENKEYEPETIVLCKGKPAPTQDLSLYDIPDVVPVSIQCDEPLAQTAWVIEPLHARLRYGPGRTISDDPHEDSFTKAWWFKAGQVKFGVQVEVLGCFPDQTRPVWSRTTPLYEFNPPIDVSGENSWVYIRFPRSDEDQYTLNYPNDGGSWSYGWVHVITLSSNNSVGPDGKHVSFARVCNNYNIP